jgi:TRAP-type uncharacterized transport system substrate-binding protein
MANPQSTSAPSQDGGERRLAGRRGEAFWFMGLLACAAIAVAVLWLNWAPRTPLVITGGSAEGLRHTFATALAAAARQGRLDISVQPTRGSADALQRVNDGAIDIAFVQGGLRADRRSRVRQIASLHVEPLHLLVRAELFAEISDEPRRLRGRRINLSAPQSGTYRLAKCVTRFLGLGDDDYVEVNLSDDELMGLEMGDELPDAVFTVSSLPSTVAYDLVRDCGYRVVPLPYADALTVDARLPSYRAQRGVAAIDESYLVPCVIPPYIYSVKPDVPAAPLLSVGANMLLVGNERLPAGTVRLLLAALENASIGDSARPRLDRQSFSRASEFPLHPGTREYLANLEPINVGGLVAFAAGVGEILAPTAGGLFFLWQWMKQRRRRQRGETFAGYVERVNAIEGRLLQFERRPEWSMSELLEWQGELNALKHEAIGRFARGELQSEELMGRFLTLVNDAREEITRLILYERRAIGRRREQAARPRIPTEDAE